MKNIYTKIYLTIILFFIISFKPFATTYTWTGSTSTSWSTSTNWSPSGVPSTSDIVVISNQTNNPLLTSNKTISKITLNSGTLNLNTYTLTISSQANFNSGSITNGLVYSNVLGTFYFSGSTFGAKVSIKAASIYLDGSTFNDSVWLYKKNNSNVNSKGGNTFNSYFSYENIGNGSIVLSDSLPDIFNSTLDIINDDAGTFYLAHRGTGNEFNSNLNVYGKKIYFNYYGTATFGGNIHFYSPGGEIYFGYSTGSSSLASGKTITLDSTISSGNLYFQNFTQVGSGTLGLTLIGSAHLYFKSGTTFNATLTCSAPFIHLDGARFSGTSSFTNNATANVTSLGGNYFGGNTTIINNSTSSYIYSLGSTIIDSFATTTTIQNNTGVVSINNAVFIGNVTLNNYDSSTTSNRFILNNTGQTIFQSGVHMESIISGMEIGVEGTSVFEEGIVPDTIVFSSGSISFTNAEVNKSFIFNLNGTNSSLTLNGGNVFNGNLYFKGHDIDVNRTTFNGIVQIIKNGSTDITWSGSNFFNSTTTITDSSTSGHFLKLGNSFSDTYNGNVTFIQKGAGNLYPAYSHTSYFKGNVTVDGTSAITFGANNVGNIVFNGTSTQTINKSSSYAPIFKKITFNKPSGVLTLNTPITVSDSISFLKGIINTDTTNLITLNSGGKLIGASDSSFVNGPFKKIGNAAFVFPIGKNISYGYRPIEITAPSSSSDAYTAQYVKEQQTLGNTLDTSIEHLNACEYWKLIRNTGTSKVRLTINWNHDSCDFINPAYMRIAGWNGSIWKDFGNYTYTGDSIKGNSKTIDSTTTISTFTTAYKRCIYFKSYVTKHDVYCRGGADGVAVANVDGGTPPYIYKWSKNMGVNSFASQLKPDTYIVSITDTLNCYISDTVVINQPDSMIVSFTKELSTCGNADGSITATASGGVGVLKKYYWTLDGDTSNVHENLPAGRYTIHVSDSNACSLLSEVELSDDNGPDVTLISTTDALCDGDKNGSAIVSIDSPYSKYKINWSNSPIDTLEEINNVFAGTYSIKVTDSLGCITYDEIEISSASPILIDLSSTNTPCGENDGLATADVTGGTEPYTYTWNSGTGIENYVQDLYSGLDTLIITDDHGCTAVKTFEILNTGELSITSHLIANETCFLNSSGSAYVSVSGGTGPYSYSWYPYGGENDTAIGLISDEYSITVVDANGCRQNAKITINSPDKLEASIQVTFPTGDSTSDGTALGIVRGGTPPYSFEWYTGSNNISINELSFGDIDTLFVTDSYGCVAQRALALRSDRPYLGCNDIPQSPNACGPDPFSCSPCTTMVTLDVTDYGAIPDDLYSDQCAFEKVSKMLSLLDDNTIKILYIPLGNYIVGRQEPYINYYLFGDPVMSFSRVKNLKIVGEKIGNQIPKLIFENCMKYGVFDNPSNPTNALYGDYWGSCDGATHYYQQAFPGTMIYMTNCINVTIQDIDLNGNIANTIIGGGYTQGIQIGYDGLIFNNCRKVTINNISANNFGRDGIFILQTICPFDPLAPRINFNIFNSTFNYNGRDGMTWDGGTGLTVDNCNFNFNGLTRITSLYASGIDIEFQLSNIGNSNGIFKKCNFKYNYYFGIQTPHPSFVDPFYTHDYYFENCTIIGSETAVAAANPGAPKMWFKGCTFGGTLINPWSEPVNSQADNLTNINYTKFEGCKFLEEFEDLDLSLPKRSFGNYRWLNEFGWVERARFIKCNYENNYRMNLIWLAQDFITFTPPQNVSTFNNNVMNGIHMRNLGRIGGTGCHLEMGVVAHTVFINKFVIDNAWVTPGCPGIGRYWFTIGPSCTGITPTGSPIYTVEPIADLFLNSDHYASNRITHYTSDPCESIHFIYPDCFFIGDRHDRLKREPSNNESNQVTVYPNPASNKLIIENHDGSDLINIVNLYGENVMHIQNNNSIIEIDITTLVEGMYFIYVGNNQSIKFIKLDR